MNMKKTLRKVMIYYLPLGIRDCERRASIN